MHLYLVQHGEAKTEAEDPERPLTDRGRQTVERVARWAVHAGVAVDEIRHSGKRRAEQTAEILVLHLKPTLGMRAVAGLHPNDDVHPVAASLERETKPLMLVGHLPFLGRLVGQLVTGNADWVAVRFTNAGIVCLDRVENRWSIDWAVPPHIVT